MPQMLSQRDPCEHRHAPVLDRKALAAGLAKGRDRCEAAGMRWTPLRERALEMLLQADGPVKAYDLIANFKPEGVTAPPSVYRSLDALVELGLVHRIPSLNAYLACHGERDGHVASFLICDCCGAVEEVETPTEQVLAVFAEKADFRVTTLILEAHGRCAACQA